MKHKNNVSGGGRNWGLILTVPLCLVLAVYFLISGLIPTETEDPAKALEPVWYELKTARGEVLKTKVMVGNCFICHTAWVGIPEPDVVRPRFAHGVIKLDHGANDRCFNCHLIQDRNKYTADDGSGIMPKNVHELCARCHGLVYNDWLEGTHGIRRGKWSPQTQFERKNFVCTECHDPHSPKFEFKEYTPPPVWPDKYIRRSAENIENAKAS